MWLLLSLLSLLLTLLPFRSGIIGLYTAYILTQQGLAKQITVIAEHLPGDTSARYTSPWAGGNFSTVSADTPLARKHDKATFLGLKHLLDAHGSEAGLKQLKATEYYVEGSKVPSKAKLEDMKTFIPDLRILDASELPAGKTFGITFTTFNFFCPKFIAFLKGYVEARGVSFVRRGVAHVDEAFLAPETQTVFNCTGLGSRNLGGVEDEAVYPTRGQVVVVKAPHVNENISVDGPVFTTYVIPRPYSGGHVVLGGYMQANNNDPSTYGYESASILERVKDLFPRIEPFEIVREAAGLRPSRKGGVRIEKEERPHGVVIHNYGAGGTGYQSGYGMALEAVELLGYKAKL